MLVEIQNYAIKNPMILLNFAHPLTEEHLTHIQTLTGRPIGRIIDLNSQIDPHQPLVPQVVAMVERAGLSATEWQTAPLLINPPSLNYIALVLLAELHGRMGYFPACLRLRPVAGTTPLRFEVAEMLNLPYAQSPGGCQSRATHKVRASTTYSLLSRRATTVARPIGVNPTICVPPLAQVKCPAHSWVRGLNRGTNSPVA